MLVMLNSRAFPRLGLGVNKLVLELFASLAFVALQQFFNLRVLDGVKYPNFDCLLQVSQDLLSLGGEGKLLAFG